MSTSTTSTTSFAVGSRAHIVHTVREADAATNWGNDVPVLATPILLWLSEIAAMNITDAALAVDGKMTVGAHHDTGHLAPTLIGESVTVDATLIEVTDKTLSFDVEARDSRGLVLRGRHRRGIVDRARFLAKLDTIGRGLAAGTQD